VVLAVLNSYKFSGSYASPRGGLKANLEVMNALAKVRSLCFNVLECAVFGYNSWAANCF
jgi:hypothetical protein